MNIRIVVLLLTWSFLPKVTAKFVDVIDSSGVDFQHFNGMSGEFYFHEMMGGGAALFDYDNDGDLDLYLTQGQMIGELSLDKSIIAPKNPQDIRHRLYRNDSDSKDVKFTEVTSSSGIDARGYGMGASAGDIDNDGDLDLYLSNFGQNQMWRNNGDGTFTDITKRSQTGGDEWSVTASFVDINNDGYLDLYVVNYVDYDISNPLRCRSYDGALDYCSPQGFKATADVLYLNQKDGSFTNITSKSGIIKQKQPGLGVVTADFNNDGWQDIYVANDGMPNNLWINNQRGGFTDKAMMSGVAVNMTGVPEASMGVDTADYDNDGDLDLFMTHLNRQTNTLYINNGKGWFSDASVRMGLAATSFRSTGFGTKWVDFDNDGLLDLFSANGAVIKEPEQVRVKDPYPLKQVNQLWKNIGAGKYKEISSLQDESFLRPTVSRAAASGDINNDGFVDIVVTNSSDKPQILQNISDEDNSWIGFSLRRKDLNRDDLGAKVKVKTTDKTLIKVVKTDGSYISSNDPRLVFGIGTSKVESVVIIWSDGKEQQIKKYENNQYNIITRDK